LAQAYLEKNPLAALQAFAIRLGADQLYEKTLPWQRTGKHKNGLQLLMKET